MNMGKQFAQLIAGAVNQHLFFKQHYQGLVNEKGIVAGTQFHELPTLKPQDIVEHREQFTVHPETYRFTASSGTTGKPKVFPKTARDTAVSSEVMELLFTQCSVVKGDVVCIAQPFDLSHIGYISMAACQALAARAVPVGLSLDEEALDALIRLTNSTVLFTSPSKFRAMYDSEPAVPEHLRTVILAGEKIEPQELVALSQQFGVQTFSLYGSEDTDGLGYSCSDCGGYHLLDDYFHFEYLDLASGQVTDGTGSVVITSKYAQGIPLIRYELGDIHQPIPNRCGNVGKTVQILGRIDDSIQLFDGVTLFGYQLAELGQSLAAKGTYQFESLASPDCTHITLKLEHTCQLAIEEAILAMERCCPDVKSISDLGRVSFQVIENSKIKYTKRGKKPLVIKMEHNNE
ncbi:phenylacetate-CoA ligase [Vibrio crassostreae]|uniref:phenylacetate--CoA ligase family protein n=1 Tax=Vibrio crassostreae TaxID=246167 RepID=UPI001046F2DA|nr:AMP-binding protein [Vibrio crassostreae]TCN81578.1 phenylacetate-CoA ligase [Vibrio crassostreae]CAK2459694.1 phenylacetate-CoA ligase [Vibrio crassostreae]CAK2466425.1 phenylacetate-CoA ligase [Vibrio crassostreae]CAK3759374.1 phenylacetate-CoA ligase [Vibrio crassostreae]CAK3947964.1 phenylacetate-CoA ligase [Vibrio crassostreae]